MQTTKKHNFPGHGRIYYIYTSVPRGRGQRPLVRLPVDLDLTDFIGRWGRSLVNGCSCDIKFHVNADLACFCGSRCLSTNKIEIDAFLNLTTDRPMGSLLSLQ